MVWIKGNIVGQAVDGGVIACGDTDQQVGIGDGGEVAQNLRELGGAEFGRSTGAMGQAGQSDVLRC